MTETDQARTKNYVIQLKGSAVFKIGAILATFLAMPIMIKYLGVELFGIWATMLTLITWIMLFDLGIGNGLKNKIAESLAQNKIELTSRYISTAYVLIGAGTIVVFLLFLWGSFLVPWQAVFNTEVLGETQLREVVVTLSCFVFFNFWISLVNQIYHGLQQSSVVVFGQFISNLFALIFSYVLYLFAETSLIYIVWAYGVSLVSANIFLSFRLFSKKIDLRPSISSYSSDYISPLLSLGIKFFIIQLAVLVIFMTDKILITQLIGPAAVTPYEVLFKLFSVFTVLHGLILLPLWPAYSDAYVNKDFGWIRAQIKKQMLIAIGLFCAAFVMALIGPFVVSLWIGPEVEIDQQLYYLFALFIVLSVWSNVFAYFVNATGQLNTQLATAIIAAVLNIPLSIMLVSHYGMGLEGIVISTIVCLSLYSLFGPIQVYKILKR